MMKKMSILVLCLLVIISTVTAVQAADSKAVAAVPTLSYNGETAQCHVQIAAPGKAIYVRMELWYGSTLIDSWLKSGSSTVTLNETCGVQSGLTYTLIVSGSIGSETFSCAPVSKKCP